VTYQIIIISEILKQRKQLIINGRDYVENPENKFTLTVLGAVAELERAKIIERASRGRQQRLSQGHLLGCGNNLYGYDYHRRTPFSPPRMTVNEVEAQVVRYVFSEYAKGGIGMAGSTEREKPEPRRPRRASGPGHGCGEPVPGHPAGVHDFRQTGENRVGEPMVAQLAPNPLDRVELRAVRRQLQ
jgi:hypothetical protein